MEEAIVVSEIDFYIVQFSTFTNKKLLGLGESPAFLWLFYMQTAKRQSLTHYKRINRIYATDSYCMNGLSWGKEKFYRAKEALVKAGLIQKIEKRDSDNKIVGHYIQLNNPSLEHDIESIRRVQSHRFPEGGLSQTVEKSNTNTKDIKDKSFNNINTDINTDNINTGEEEISVGEPIQITKSILMHFNTVYNTKYRAVEPLLKLVEYWTKHYSLDEIQQAITNSKQDTWWADKLTPTILLRKMNPNHEAVDYIGKFLNMPQAETFDATPLTDIQLWQIAKDNQINLEDVQQKHKDVLNEAEKGSFPVKYKYDSVEKAVRAWIDMGISKGQIKHCNELELMQLENDHPDKVKERAYYFGLMRERGELE